MGTPGYMAPEQAVAEGVDERSDLYSLGVLIWELCAGRQLFPREAITAMIKRQLTETPPPLRKASNDPTLPRDLEELVASMLSVPADDRPRTAKEVSERLEALLARRERRSRPPSQAPSARTSRSKMVLGAAAVCVALLGTWIVAARYGRASSSSDDDSVVETESSLTTSVPRTAVISQAPLAPDTTSAPRHDPPPTLELPDEASESVSPAVARRIRALLNGERRLDRRRAGQWLKEHADEANLPELIVAIAELESARGCRQTNSAAHRLRRLGDTRALPSLLRFRDLPDDGCGFLSLSDCYACIRGPVRRAVYELSH